jgi:hypothetical protein
VETYRTYQGLPGLKQWDERMYREDAEARVSELEAVGPGRRCSPRYRMPFKT